jgi:hypothetical protein
VESFLAPVTALECVVASFGVGTWQARLVCSCGLVASSRSARRRHGDRQPSRGSSSLMLATNYVYVIYDRAALMESAMAALMVASWAATRARRNARRTVRRARRAARSSRKRRRRRSWPRSASMRCCQRCGPGLTRGRRMARSRLRARRRRGRRAGAVRRALLTEFRFNWQMSVTRKPSYSIRAFVDRASWLPIVHDVTTRMWFTTVLAAGAAVGIASAIRRAAPAERLLVWWIVLGIAELVLHDTGNERRFVQLIPPVVALAG